MSTPLGSSFTTEQIITSPLAFGLTSATPCQRAICRIHDGLPLGELAMDEDVREMVGDVDGLPDKAPVEFLVLAAIRTFKSLFAAASILRASQVVDVSGCSAGDIIRISVVSLKLDNTRAIMGHLLGNIRAKTLLKGLLASKPDEATDEHILLRHPSGRIIEVVPVPLDRAGGSITSFWSAGIVADEAPRMLGVADAIKNWTHLRDAGLGRLLPGAKFCSIGSPHAPMGPIWEIVEEHWGKPTADLVVLRARGPALNPFWWTPERCDDLRRRNPTAYRSDVLCEWANVNASAFDLDQIERSMRAPPKRVNYHAPILCLDPASLRGRDRFTYCVCAYGVPYGEEGRIKQRPCYDGKTGLFSMMVDEWANGAQVVDPDWKLPPPFLHVHEIGALDDLVSDPTSEQFVDVIASIAHRWGTRDVWSDQRESLSLGTLVRARGLNFHEHAYSSPSKGETVDRFRRHLADGTIVLPRNAQLRSEVMNYAEKPTPTGFRYEARGSGRDDYVSAVLMACRAELDGGLSGSIIPRGGRPPIDYSTYDDDVYYDGPVYR
jgi:hypothetical protein